MGGRGAFYIVEATIPKKLVDKLYDILLEADCLNWHQDTFQQATGPRWQVTMRKVKGCNLKGSGQASEKMLAAEKAIQDLFHGLEYPILLFSQGKVPKKKQNFIKKDLEENVENYRSYIEMILTEEAFDEEVRVLVELWLQYMQMSGVAAAAGITDEKDYNTIGTFLLNYLLDNEDFEQPWHENAYYKGYFHLCGLIDDANLALEDYLDLAAVTLRSGIKFGMIGEEAIPVILEGLKEGYLAHCKKEHHPPKLRPAFQLPKNNKVIDFAQMKNNRKKKK